MLLLPTCYLIKFGRPRSNHLGAGRIQKKTVDAEVPP